MSEKVVIKNRKARHNFQILDTVEAGLALMGSEVKSLRDGKGNLQEAYCRIKNGEMWLLQAHIAIYNQASVYGHDDPQRSRKCLLHRKEIDQIEAEVSQGGLALIPLRVYFKRGKAKVEIGIARGKKQHDKRQDLKKREQRREMERLAKGGRVKI